MTLKIFNLSTLLPERKKKLAYWVAVVDLVICIGKIIAAYIDYRFFIEGVMFSNPHPVCYNPFISSRYGILMLVAVVIEIWADVELLRSTKQKNIDENVVECQFKVRFWRIIKLIFFGIQYFYAILIGSAAKSHHHFTTSHTLPLVLTMFSLATKDLIMFYLVRPWNEELLNPKKRDSEEVSGDGGNKSTSTMAIADAKTVAELSNAAASSPA